jgi:hypothetical protein
MADRPCRRCALAPGFTVCRHCLVAVLKGQTSAASRWVAFAWAVATAFASAGIMVLLDSDGIVAWSLAVVAVAVGATVGAVLTEQRGIHPLESIAPLPIETEQDAT